MKRVRVYTLLYALLQVNIISCCCLMKYPIRSPFRPCSPLPPPPGLPPVKVLLSDKPTFLKSSENYDFFRCLLKTLSYTWQRQWVFM